MDDKDRLREKLHDKGKADEDRFIAEQERQRLERRKQAAAAPHGTNACPKDGTQLVPHTVRGTTIDVCPACQGVWLDKGEMGVILTEGGEAAAVHWVKSLFRL